MSGGKERADDMIRQLIRKCFSPEGVVGRVVCIPMPVEVG